MATISTLRRTMIATLLAMTVSTARAQTNATHSATEMPLMDLRRQNSVGGGRPLQGQDRVFLDLLTDEQRASFRKAIGSQREKLLEIESKLAKARQELNAASVVKFDEDSVRAKALAVAKLEAELAVLRAKALSQITPPLSAQQIEQVKNAPAELRFRPQSGGQPTTLLPMQRIPQRDENDLPSKLYDLPGKSQSSPP